MEEVGGDRHKRSIEESLLLLPKEEEEEEEIGSTSSSTSTALTWSVLLQEVKRLGFIGAPLVAVILSQYLLQVISVMMVGHLGELSLSSTALGISLSGVTGFSLLLGMAGALETICGQAYGAEQYQKLGLQTYTAIFSLFLVCLPISLIWIYMGKLLVLIGQDPLISHEAGRFTIWLVPSLFAYATLQPLIRYFQTQSLILPMFISSCVTLCFHIPLSWVLIFKSGLGNLGGAMAISISYWLNVILLVLYMRFCPSCAKTRVPISMELFQGIREFFLFAIPSTVMICLEWWSFELLILMSGLLPNPQLETSVLSVCLNTISTLYTIPYGLGAAGSFSNEKEVVDYVTEMAPLICISVILDSLQGVLSGVARGCGWQHIGAFINLGAYYLCGIPIAATLGFWFKLRGKGLWIGIQFGAFVQVFLLCLVTSCTNWEKQASKARERIFEYRSVRNGLEDREELE
ncbi:protein DETOXIFICATION 12 isoform X2 [Morus notabilis]|uniref:protein DETOXIFICATION 12 isoform X2 n=1 Tax=Morus notabilis TaxID=981085 RepID=UPI000CED2C38|nr:protein DETOXIFICATION 12 isoform X2 [Morus notabilis]